MGIPVMVSGVPGANPSPDCGVKTEACNKGSAKKNKRYVFEAVVVHQKERLENQNQLFVQAHIGLNVFLNFSVIPD